MRETQRLSGGHVRSSVSASKSAFDSAKNRRSLLEARGELNTLRRKLERTERALDSLSHILSLIPDPIEVVAADYTILFANRASRLLHDNDRLEGSFYYRSVMGLDEAPDDSPILRAIDEDRETTYTAASEDGDVYDIAVTPIVLSDGRNAAMCYTRAAATDTAPEENTDDDRDTLQKIAELSAATLDGVLEQITDAVALLHNSGQPILFNRAFSELTGLKDIEPGCAEEIADVLQPGRPGDGTAADVLDALVRRGETGRFEAEIAGTAGKTVPVEMSVSGITRKTDKEPVILISLRDLREINDIRARIIDVLIPPRSRKSKNADAGPPAPGEVPDDAETDTP